MSQREPLPADVEILLEAERRVAPPDEAQARVGRRLEVTLGVAVGLSGAAATASAAKATAVTVGKSLALKLVLGAVGAALVGGGAYVAMQHNSRPRVIAAAASRHAEPAALPAPYTPPIIPAVAPPAAAPAHALHPRTRPDNFASEQAFLEEARAALVGGAPERALRLLDQERQRFADGPLSEARESLLIQALAAAGHSAAARAHAAEFRRRFPHSLFQPAVDASLDGH